MINLFLSVSLMLSAVVVCSACPSCSVSLCNDFTLMSPQGKSMCVCNEDGTADCEAYAGQKADFESTWQVTGGDLRNLWISLIWDNCYNSSTRSFACPEPCIDNDLAIHGQCETQTVTAGKHHLKPFRLTVPTIRGIQTMRVLCDGDWMSGDKFRDRYVGTFRVNIH